PWFLLIYVDIAAFLLLLFSRKFRGWTKTLARRESKVIVSVVFAISICASVGTVWANNDSINELNQAQRMGILNYEAYAIYASATTKLEDPSKVSAEAIAKLKNIQEPAAPAYFGAAKGRNVIILQMEAFQNFLLNTKIHGKEVTPNLNKLMKDVYYFPHFYQMVGQGNTSDAEFVVNTSFYIPQHGAASQDYGGLALPSMPKTLHDNGYQTATFHTNDVQFWNRKELYKALGFDNYYDASYFGNDDMVFFGSSDEVLYDKTIDKLTEMNKTGQPFYAQLISMSSHHPFNIPNRKVKFDLPERYEGTLVGDYIEAQNYTDYAFGQFVDKLKANGLWDNTVLVIYGDHLGLPKYTLSSHEKNLMEEMFGRDYDYSGMLNIPLFVVAPGITEGKVMPRTGGQVDIFPTVANLLG
ncbi:MAG: LTA synthase family protein, partial [Cohnella sp.]|nr:LTA synthase family protein [Cohnella sp.]